MIKDILFTTFVVGCFALLFLMGYTTAKGMENSLIKFGMAMVILALVIEFIVSFIIGRDEDD